jgi:hypothetical protein
MEHPSTDWSQGGPIIEQLRAYGKHRFIIESDGDNVSILAWSSPYAFCNGYGPTILIAAMRCYVASKLGDEVDIPEELNDPIAATSRVIVKATADIGKSLK